MVRNMAEEALNAMLDARTEQLWAERYGAQGYAAQQLRPFAARKLARINLKIPVAAPSLRDRDHRALSAPRDLGRRGVRSHTHKIYKQDSQSKRVVIQSP